jgi:hypothetical protein
MDTDASRQQYQSPQARFRYASLMPVAVSAGAWLLCHELENARRRAVVQYSVKRAVTAASGTSKS